VAKILFVEDDDEVAESVIAALKPEKHVVELVNRGEHAIERLELYGYDLIILDWELPNMSGVEICTRFRAQGGTTPILMLTGRGKEADKETALDSGADDYLTKPFGVRELNARLRALLRRPANVVGNRLRIGLLELDTSERSLLFNGGPVSLQPKEFAILEFFMRHPDTVHSTEILVNSIWSSDSSGSIQSLYTYMKSLRKKISGSDGECAIKTVHGVGYKLVSK